MGVGVGVGVGVGAVVLFTAVLQQNVPSPLDNLVTLCLHSNVKCGCMFRHLVLPVLRTFTYKMHAKDFNF